MTREEQLHLITRKCVEANPEIVEVVPNQDAHGGFDPEWHPRTIRLSDVLLAIDGTKKDFKFIVFNERVFRAGKYNRIDGQLWNLRQDRLEDQTEECLSFLAGLLK